MPTSAMHSLGVVLFRTTPLGVVPGCSSDPSAKPVRLAGCSFEQSLVSAARHSQRQPEPNEMDAVGWGHHEAIGRARELDIVVPAAAAEDLELARRRTGGITQVGLGKGSKPVGAPFPHVAVHIVKSPGIGTL